MADPLTILLLVAAGEAADGTTREVAAATHDALGGDSRVLVRESKGLPSDPQALAGEAETHADAVVELRWAAPHHRRATVRMHVSGTDLWIDRKIVFRRSDEDAERARTLGFAIASTLPEPAGPALASGSPPSGGSKGAADESRGARGAASNGGSTSGSAGPTSAERVGEAGSEARGASAGSAGSNTPPSAATAGAPSSKNAGAPAATAGVLTAIDSNGTPGPDSVAPEQGPSRLSRVGLDIFVVDAAGDEGAAQEVGGAAAADWFFLPNVSARIGGSVRTATLSQVGGDLVKVLGSAGLAVHPWRSSPGRPLGASLRVDYLALYETLTNLAAEGRNATTMDGWLSGLDVVADACLQFAPNVDAVLGGGFEVFAPTFVNIAGQKLTTLPPFRALAEGGLRLRF